MSNHRYSFSFIISTIVFALVGFSFFLLAEKIEKPKQLTPKVIKIAVITPVVKKVIEKKSLPPQPLIAPIIPIPPKVKKKVKHKKVIKKKIIKRVKPKKRVVKKKKIIKKRIVKKRVVKKHLIKPKKRVVKKRIVKKRSIKKKIIKKRVIKPKKIKREVIKEVEPIIEEVYYERRVQPKRVLPVIQPPVQIKTPVITPKVEPQIKVDKSAKKREFLSQVRGKIIANKRYPKMALRRYIQGAVKVKFDITSNGTVSNIQFINGKTILQKSVRKAVENSFPINIPNNLRSELPIHDIYITIHFNIN